jgi:hypothetical protein
MPVIADPYLLDELTHVQLRKLLSWCETKEVEVKHFAEDLVSEMPWEDSWETHKPFLKHMNAVVELRRDVQEALRRNQVKAVRVAERLKESA